MESTGGESSNPTAAVSAVPPGGESSSSSMTYAHLDSLTRLNTEDLSQILTAADHHQVNGADFYEASATAGAAGDADQEPPAEEDEGGSSNSVSQLSVHSYCKQPVNGGGDPLVPQNSGGAAGPPEQQQQQLKTATTRRVLLIDEGQGDLEMAKSDVEFLLRGEAAGIVLRDGKRSEVLNATNLKLAI